MKLSDKIANKIIDLIIEEDLKSGDKLPNEYNLAKDLDIGRSTLREAVRSLESQNILEVRQGSGTYISKNIGVSNDPLGFKFIEDTKKLTEDLFTLRYILEPEVAMLAAQNRTEEEIEELEALAETIEKTVKASHDMHIELDIQFHSIIAKMSRNIGMVNLVPIINQSIILYNSHYTNEISKVEMIASHRQITKSIREKNPVRARYSMQRHILNVQDKLALNNNS